MKAKLLSYTIGATIVDEDDQGNVTARHVTETRPVSDPIGNACCPAIRNDDCKTTIGAGA